MNKWRWTSTPLIHLHGIYRHKITFALWCKEHKSTPLLIFVYQSLCVCEVYAALSITRWEDVILPALRKVLSTDRLSYQQADYYLTKWQTDWTTGRPTDLVHRSMLQDILWALIIAWPRYSDNLRHLNHHHEAVFEFSPEPLESSTSTIPLIFILMRDLKFVQRVRRNFPFWVYDACGLAYISITFWMSSLLLSA
jgi:hypothetical protein